MFKAHDLKSAGEMAAISKLIRLGGSRRCPSRPRGRFAT